MFRRPGLFSGCAVLALLLGWQMWLSAQPLEERQAAAVAVQAGGDSGQATFEVVQSFDAKYEGDSAGHLGRISGLVGRRPQVALEDPVFRAGEQVGTVTGLGWSAAHGTLEVEFRPRPNVRVAVGDIVSIAVDGQFRPQGR